MKYNIYGKILMIVLAIVLKLEYIAFSVFIALGHIMDTHRLVIWEFLTKKQKYQSMSEDIIFLFAYFNNCLNLNPDKSYKVILNNCIIDKSEEETVKKVFKYYATDFLNKASPNNVDKLVKKSIEIISLNANDGVTLFRIVEEMFDAQDKATNQAKLNTLRGIADIFNINYHRTLDTFEYAHEEESTIRPKINTDFKKHYTESKKEHSAEESRSYNRSYTKSSNSTYNSKKSNSQSDEPLDLTPKEVKDAFKVLGLNHSPLPEMMIVKKVYKEYVKKYHPDILKNKNLSQNEIKSIEEKMLKINASMDIIKKHLAKV